MKNNLIAIVLAIIMFGCGDDDKDKTVSVQNIRLNKTELELLVGEDFTMEATIVPENATDKTVEWQCYPSKIASVDDNGKVTALAVGETTITARANGSTSKPETYCTLKVIEYRISENINGITINGVTWATRNVDVINTFAATPQDAGKLYQWNRKKAWSATGAVSGWDNTEASGSYWADENDPSPTGWQIPTIVDFYKLLDKDKVNSALVYTKSFGIPFLVGTVYWEKGANEALFLPMAGYRIADGTLHGVPDNNNPSAAEFAAYWGRQEYGEFAYILNIHDDRATFDPRNFGHFIRCVKAK